MKKKVISAFDLGRTVSFMTFSAVFFIIIFFILHCKEAIKTLSQTHQCFVLQGAQCHTHNEPVQSINSYLLTFQDQKRPSHEQCLCMNLYVKRINRCYLLQLLLRKNMLDANLSERTNKLSCLTVRILKNPIKYVTA